ncbi:MAG TPA: DUF2339 domain-containing protein [Kofleriaceae bacterium]|nr:DUF2339 domain-containing protein [Kofleriaceae bacterium]
MALFGLGAGLVAVFRIGGLQAKVKQLEAALRDVDADALSVPKQAARDARIRLLETRLALLEWNTNPVSPAAGALRAAGAQSMPQADQGRAAGAAARPVAAAPVVTPEVAAPADDFWGPAPVAETASPASVVLRADDGLLAAAPPLPPAAASPASASVASADDFWRPAPPSSLVSDGLVPSPPPPPADGGLLAAPPLSRVDEALPPVAAGAAPPVERARPVAAAAPAMRPAPPPARLSFEELIGKRWMTWIGAVALIIAAALFINVAVDRDWLGPAARTALAAGLGVALIGAGERWRAMRALSQGLIGAGVAILYVAAFAGFAHYELYGRGLGFVSLLAITVAGMALALRHDAKVIAVLAVLGGFLAPVLISSGEDHRDALCVYLTILDLGVLAVAFARQWRVVEVLALIGTWSLYSGWYALHGATSAPAPTLAWLFVFHAIFVILPFIHHIRRRQPLEISRFLAALSGAGVGFGYSAHMLADQPRALGGVALGLAASYLVMGILVRRAIPSDRRAIFAFLALVTGFVTLAAALILGGHATTIAWAIEGPVLLALADRYDYRPARLTGMLALVLATGRYFASGWPAHPGELTPFLNSQVATGLAVAVALAAYAVLHHRRPDPTPLDRALMVGAAIGTGALVLVVTHGELVETFADPAQQLAARTSVVWVWVVGASGFLAASRRVAAARAARLAAASCVAIAVVLASLELQALPPGAVAFVNLRLVTAAAVALPALWVGRAMIPAAEPEPALGITAVVVALGGVWLVLGIEAGEQWPGEPLRALALTWAAYGAALAIVGHRFAGRVLRLSATASTGMAALCALFAFQDPPGALAFLNPRFATAATVIALALALARVLHRSQGTEAGLGWPVAYVALGVLFVVLGIEAYQQFPAADQMALSIVWAVYACALIVAGFVVSRRELRLAGLAILGVTALKLPVLDLAAVDQLYRVVSFLVAGVVMIGVSFVYHRVDQRFAAAPRP